MPHDSGDDAPSGPPTKGEMDPAFPAPVGEPASDAIPRDDSADFPADDTLASPEEVTSDGVWIENEIEVLDESPAKLPNRRAGGATGVVAAAMLGLGEILEPEKTKVEIVQVDDQPLDPPPIKLDFSDVPDDNHEPPDNKAQL